MQLFFLIILNNYYLAILSQIILLCCPVPRRKVAEMGPAISFTLWCIPASIKIFDLNAYYVTIAHCFLRIYIICIAHTQRANAV